MSLALAEPVHAGPGDTEVDAWLAAHPKIAAAMVWEFPPPTPRIRLPKVKPILWPTPQPIPYPVVLPPLGDSVLPETTRIVTDPRGDEPSDEEPRVQLDGASSASSYVLPPDGPIPLPKTVPLPGDLFLPGGIKKSEYGAEIRDWTKWPDWAKSELRARFADARAWAEVACPLYAEYAASDFTTVPPGFDDVFSSTINFDPAPIADPPVNLQPHDPVDPVAPWPMVSSSTAFAIYVRGVAEQLALEITDCLPWSITGESAKDLGLLFDGRYSFRYVPAGPSVWGEMTATGHIIAMSVTPAPPLIVLGFFAKNGLIGNDRTETLLALLSWEREELWHVVSGTSAVPMGAGELYFGYNGRPPVSRMINGTVMAAPVEGNGWSFYDPQTHHWVGGCGGASGFNHQVLRAVNIAAEQTAYSHFQNHFSLDGGTHAGLAHADDPYGMRSAPEIPTADILLDEVTFNAWFVDQPDPVVRDRNTSRRAADLYLAYLPQKLLELHCQDTLWFNNDHASSRVYGWAFKSVYTVAELEQMGLWTGIEAKLASIGGCSALGYN